MLWQEIQINGASLEVRDRGEGEPIVVVHGSMGDELMAVLEQPALAEHYRVIDYHRRGFGRSTCPETPVSIEQQSRDCQAVMKALGVTKAHLSGQSYGGPIILQVALDVPEMVQSLALLEPALPSIMFQDADFIELSTHVGSLYQAGDKVGALHAFGKGVCGEDYFDVFSRTLPAGWFEHWVSELDTIMQSDMAALPNWKFTQRDAARITQPVLNMRGETTISYMREIFQRLRSWMPKAESSVLPGASHAMAQTNPQGAAERQASFFGKHTILESREAKA